MLGFVLALTEAEELVVVVVIVETLLFEPIHDEPLLVDETDVLVLVEAVEVAVFVPELEVTAVVLELVGLIWLVPELTGAGACADTVTFPRSDPPFAKIER